MRKILLATSAALILAASAATAAPVRSSGLSAPDSNITDVKMSKKQMMMKKKKMMMKEKMMKDKM